MTACPLKRTYRCSQRYAETAQQPNLRISSGPMRFGTSSFGKGIVSQKNGLPRR